MDLTLLIMVYTLYTRTFNRWIKAWKDTFQKGQQTTTQNEENIEKKSEENKQKNEEKTTMKDGQKWKHEQKT